MPQASPVLRPRAAVAAAGTGIAAVASLQSLLIPALGAIGADLHADAVGVTWTLTAWLITAAVATPLLGRAGDLVGRRRVMLVALLAVAVGSVAAAFAPTLELLLAARVLQGLGGAAFPLAFGLVRDAVPPQRVAGTIGILAAIMAVGSGLGTVVAGPVSETIGWRWLFVIPVALTALAITLLLRSGVPAVRRPGRIDPVPAVLLSGWLVALLLPLSSGAQWGWGSPLVVGLFVLAAVLLVAWVAVEIRSHAPLVDMRMMRIPAVWTSNATALFTGAAMFGVWAFLPRLAETPATTGWGLGATVSAVGIIMLPMLVAIATVGLVLGPLTRVFPLRVLLASGAALTGLASLGIAAFHAEVWQFALAALVLGIGTGLVTSTTPNVIVRAVSGDQIGIATGMNSNIRTIGGALGTTVFTAVVAGTVDAAGLPTEGAYVAAFVVGGALALAGAVTPFLARVPRPVTEPIPVGQARVLAEELEAEAAA
ncbi:MAG: MFS transporter [Actinomycetales bacterium]|nr:MFS transporter [Actinomycetales bacterium]